MANPQIELEVVSESDIYYVITQLERSGDELLINYAKHLYEHMTNPYYSLEDSFNKEKKTRRKRMERKRNILYRRLAAHLPSDWSTGEKAKEILKQCTELKKIMDAVGKQNCRPNREEIEACIVYRLFEHEGEYQIFLSHEQIINILKGEEK